MDFSTNERIATAVVAIITVPDNRWARVDIKSTSLLPNVLAKQAAREHGAKEAWFVDPSGYITEGSSSNAWIVTAKGRVVTRPADQGILRGVTRAVVIEVIKAKGLEFDERAFSREEAYAAREAFLTSASQVVLPVVRIDDRAIGNGAPGLIATALREQFHRHATWS
jgi:D-alanine transaminase